MVPWYKSMFSQGKLPGLLTAYVLIQPLLDILTSVATQAGLSLTLGMVVRTGFLICVVLWLVFARPYAGKRTILTLTAVVTGYLGIYTLWSLIAGGIPLALVNLKDGLKVFHFLYFGLFLYGLYRQRKFLLPLWSIAVAGSGYCLVILLAWVTGSSFASYNSGHGYCGWFFSANDVSNMILLTAPVALMLCTEKLQQVCKCQWKQTLVFVLVLFSIIFSATFIGTKLVYMGVLLYLLLAGCWFLVRAFVTKKKQLWRGLVIALGLCVMMVSLYPVSPLNTYIQEIYVPMSGDDPEALQQSQAIPGLVEVDRAKKHAELLEAAEGTWLGELIDQDPLVEKVDKLLSRRLLCMAPVLQEYLDGDISVKLLGLGYGQQTGFRKDIGHLIEMEPMALLLRHGLVGFVLYYLPFLAATLWLVIGFFRRFKGHMADLTSCSLMYSVLLAFVASLFIGHILQSISVSLLVPPLYGQLMIRTCRSVPFTPPRCPERKLP